MNLRGQAAAHDGYAVAVLLVALAVMSIGWTVAMPVWKQMAQREKESEFIFRAQQYAHAIVLYQRKFAGTFPPNLDVLLKGKFLRKKYTDPITNDDFVLVYQSAQQPQAPGGSSVPQAQTPAQGGIIGVTSKSKEASIRVYNGRSRYNEWHVTYVQVSPKPTGPTVPTTGPTPGGRPTPGGPTTPGGPGRPGGPPVPGQPNRPTIPGMPGAPRPPPPQR
jgi:type II secretory pathway pseudopilin PulG